MKFVKYIFLSLFVISCDGDDPASSSSTTCDADLAGNWILSASGNIDGGCEGDPPTSTSNAHTITLNDDCTFSTNAYSIIPDFNCADSTNSNSGYCSGSWISSSNEVIWAPDSTLEMMNMDISIYLNVIGGFSWNQDKTKLTQCLEGTQGIEENPIGSYNEYTKSEE